MLLGIRKFIYSLARLMRIIQRCFGNVWRQFCSFTLIKTCLNPVLYYFFVLMLHQEIIHFSIN